MKAASFSVFLAIVAVSRAEAFAPSRRSLGASTIQGQQQRLQSNPFLARGGAQSQQQQQQQQQSGKQPESKYITFSELSASVAPAESSNDQTNLLKNLSTAPLTKAMVSSTLFVFTDMIIKRLFRAKGISFPSSLAGCCFLATTLLASPFHESLYRVLNPGAKLMQKFMMIFLVPNLILLPLCGASYSALEVSKRKNNRNGLLVFYIICLRPINTSSKSCRALEMHSGIVMNELSFCGMCSMQVLVDGLLANFFLSLVYLIHDPNCFIRFDLVDFPTCSNIFFPLRI
jgi:hypothetical protein